MEKETFYIKKVYLPLKKIDLYIYSFFSYGGKLKRIFKNHHKVIFILFPACMWRRSFHVGLVLDRIFRN